MKEARLDFGRARVRLRNAQDAGDEKWPAAKEFEDLESLVALANQMVRAVGPGYVADDIGDGAQPMHIDRRRVGDVRAALHQNTDLALIAQSSLGGSNRARAADCNRHHVPRKQDDV